MRTWTYRWKNRNLSDIFIAIVDWWSDYTEEQTNRGDSTSDKETEVTIRWWTVQERPSGGGKLQRRFRSPAKTWHRTRYRNLIWKARGTAEGRGDCKSNVSLYLQLTSFSRSRTKETREKHSFQWTSENVTCQGELAGTHGWHKWTTNVINGIN